MENWWQSLILKQTAEAWMCIDYKSGTDNLMNSVYEKLESFDVEKASSTVWVQAMLFYLLNVTCVSSGSWSFVSSGMWQLR